jgi:hypothetical protein
MSRRAPAGSALMRNTVWRDSPAARAIAEVPSVVTNHATTSSS